MNTLQQKKTNDINFVSDSQGNYTINKGTVSEDAIIEQAKFILSSRMKEVVFSATGVNSVKDYLVLNIAEKEHEVFGIMYLDSRHRLISDEIIFRGSINSAAIYPREVVKESLKKNAASIIVYHNHPSGQPEPSAADISITNRLATGLDIVEIRLLDHLIVGGDQVISFADKGLI